MKLLIMSDSHMFNDQVIRITNKYKNKVDLMIHCGDSSLPKDSSILKPFDVIVKGNHDDEDFPQYVQLHNICITHGHIYHVYKSYEEMIELCQKLNCHVCFHGHTHVPTHQVHQGIHFVNPGSIMLNRGNYGFGTYAIANVDDQHFDVHFYHYETDQLCDDIVLEEGLELLEEFKNLIKQTQK
jgi:hypothetical protein